ncbi:MAG: response regulator [Brasilonema octagenarum HA4186-MV1]|jgi:CheY-like chemotaxis protein|nr:response regulator [Brasilonema octagenarum HA4186-MV1]
MKPVQNNSLLVVEDSDEDFEAFRRILRKSSLHAPIYRCVDGEDALEYLFQVGEYANNTSRSRPGIILLDLNLPGMDGRDVLIAIKQNATLKMIPVIIFTTSSNPKDIDVCYEHGVNGYIVKPIDLSKLKETIEIFIQYWFEITTLPQAYG